MYTNSKEFLEGINKDIAQSKADALASIVTNGELPITKHVKKSYGELRNLADELTLRIVHLRAGTARFVREGDREALTRSCEDEIRELKQEFFNRKQLSQKNILK